MVNAPLISTVIPFLNAGPWLGEAIESVLNQTYTNWEIILINDGSHGEDEDIGIRFAQKYPEKIFYFQHEGGINRGLAFSRNAGIRHATGELIAFLDADDYWLPSKLENQLEIFKKYPQVEMICEASYFWYSWNDAAEKDDLTLIGTSEGIYYPPKLMGKLYPLGRAQPPCPSGIIIKKEALKDSGGFEEKFSGVYQLYEDQAFLSKVYAKEIIYISAQANNKYRKRPDSMSSAANDKLLYNKVRLFYIEWLEDYFLQTSALKPEIKKLIDKFKSQLLAI